MMGDVLPQGKINRALKAASVENAGSPLRDPVVGLLRPRFRRLQYLHDGQHEVARRRLRLGSVIRA